MKFLFGDHHTTHPAGHFCPRIVTEHYFFSYFETPFQYERDGVMHPGAPGDMLIQPPGSVIHHGWADGSFINTWVYVSGEELDGLLARYPLPLNTAFPMGTADVLEPYERRATEEFTVRAAGYEEVLRGLTAQLIIDLYRRHHRVENAAGRLERLREELLRFPEKPWELAGMARRCGYSVSRFCALYREQFGASPKQDVLAARLALAKKMLRYTDRTVLDIAEACGFEYAPYFTKYFKAATGLTPKQYRKR